VVLAAGCFWLFYVEEDIRGKHEWDAANKNLQSMGDTADFNALIPPEVPEDQNLAASPIFQVPSPAENNNTSLSNPLRTALKDIAPNYDSLPKTGNWLKDESTDWGPLEKYLSDRYNKVFDHPESNLDVVQEIDALCPALIDLRREASVKPRCRFARDYIVTPPYNRQYGSTTDLIKLTKIINLHALAALHTSQPDVALKDVETTLQIDSGVRQEPVLVSGLVAAGLVSIQLGSVWEGLKDHRWTDDQLSRLQEDFQRIDFLADYQLSIRGEATGFFAQTLDYIRDHREAAALVLGMSNTEGSEMTEPFFARVISWTMPNGWFDMTKARGVTLYFRAAREVVDPENKRVYPERSDHLKQVAGESVSLYDVPDLLFGVSSGPVISSAPSFAEVQFRVDAAVIACALERYRLAHGAYPDSLGALRAYSSHDLPNDLMSGEPCHYKLNADGTYLLYSVGWDQVDDGGKVAYKKDDPNALDREHGDWVWQCPN